jgi:GNAT superfamily N-acetyltransferase
MNVLSLGISTDLGLIAMRGRIMDRGDYIVAITPDDPGDYRGNMLVLPHPIGSGEVGHWLDVFAREVACDGVQHVTLCWDGIQGELGAVHDLIATGFGIERTRVMRRVPSSAPPVSGVTLRPLTEDEIPRAAELAFAIGERHDEAYRQFLQRRSVWQRALVGSGAATFWGAFDGDALVGSLGLVTLGRIGRYQDVQTAPSHRRRGIAAALLAASGDAALRAGLEELVIVALAGSAAERVYPRAGFRIVELVASAVRA